MAEQDCQSERRIKKGMWFVLTCCRNGLTWGGAPEKQLLNHYEFYCYLYGGNWMFIVQLVAMRIGKKMLESSLCETTTKITF